MARLKYAQMRWSIEVYHRTLKQGCGVERAQRNQPPASGYPGLAIHVFVRFERHRHQLVPGEERHYSPGNSCLSRPSLACLCPFCVSPVIHINKGQRVILLQRIVLSFMSVHEYSQSCRQSAIRGHKT